VVRAVGMTGCSVGGTEAAAGAVVVGVFLMVGVFLVVGVFQGGATRERPDFMESHAG